MTDEVESSSPKRRALKVSRAWQRAFVAEDGGLNADGRMVVADILKQAEYFGSQYVLGNHDLTLAKAVRREFAQYFLKMLDPNFEAQMRKLMEIVNNDD